MTKEEILKKDDWQKGDLIDYEKVLIYMEEYASQKQGITPIEVCSCENPEPTTSGRECFNCKKPLSKQGR